MEKYFERFLSLRKLGEGGFAEVWLVLDEKEKKDVAVKILKQCDEASKFKFKREFHILNKLKDPGIVEVYEFLQNSHILYSMEFIKGKNIRDFLFSYDWCDEGERKGPYYIHKEGLEWAFKIFYQTCVTLNYIHSQNIIHRDLKPENIFFDMEKSYVKILDFGLVKEEEFSLYKTKQDIIQGTPAYICPELIEGREIDLRADLYSLGVIFYELLTGKLPFSSNSIMLLLEAHLKEIPISPRVHNPLIPLKMEKLILNLLEKEPYKRIPFALEVAKKIKEIWENFKFGEDETVIKEGKTVAIEVAIPEQLLIVPWIGKRKEMEEIEEGIKKLSFKRGSFFLIEGEHGIGKSRLLEEIKAKGIGYGFEVYSTIGKEETPYPFYIFEKILKDISKKHKNKIKDMGGFIFKFFPELQREMSQEDLFQTLPEIDPKGEKARLFYSFYSLIENLSTDKPVIFLFDDMHLADSSSLELINHLIYNSIFSEKQLPVLFILSFISEETNLETRNLLTKYKSKGKNIILKPFSIEETQEYVKELLQSPEELPIFFISNLYNQTGGNPFFITETIRALIDAGILARKSGEYKWLIQLTEEAQRMTIALEKLQLPESIKENLKMRLKKYNEKEIITLQGAALIGKKFPFILWQKISDFKEEEILDLAEKLLKDKILKELPMEYLEFTNDQIRKLIIEEISNLRKKRFQGKIADAILMLYKEIPEDLYFSLAQNLEASDREKEARNYYLKLGEKALKVYDLVQGEEFWNKVLKFSEDKEKIIPLKKLGDIMVYKGKYKEGEDFYKSALNLIEPESEEFFEVQISLVSLFEQRGNIKEAEDMLEKIMKLLGGKNYQRIFAWSFYHKGIIEYQKGNFEESLENFKNSLHIFEDLNEVEGVLSVYGFMGAPYFSLGRPEKTEEIFQRGVLIAEKYGDFRRKLLSLSNLVSLQLNLGLFEKAEINIEEALKIAQSVGDLRLLAHLLLTKAQILKRFKDMEKGKIYAEKARELSYEISSKEIYAYSMLNISITQLEEGAIEDAENNIKEILTLCEEMGILRILPFTRFINSYINFLRGDIYFLKEMEDDFENLVEMKDPYDICDASLYLAKAYKKENLKEKAREILKEAIKIAKEKKFFHLIEKIEREMVGL